MATLEQALKEIDTYQNIPDAAKQLWKQLCVKLWPLLNIEPSICCNEDEDMVMVSGRDVGDNDAFYFDIELNDNVSGGEDNMTFSMLTRDFATNKDKDAWLESFKVGAITPEWVMQHIHHFAIRKA